MMVNEVTHRMAWCVLGVVVSVAGQGVAQPVTTAPQDQEVKEPLAAKQQIARDRMIQLEDRMYRLVEKLGASEPDQAKRMEESLRRARELLIRRNMDQTVGLLDQGELSRAGDQQQSIMKDLDEVLRMLIEEADNSDKLKQELDRLRDFQKRIEELQRQQQQLKDKAEPASAPADLKGTSGSQRDLEARTGQLAHQMAGDQSQGASDQAGKRAASQSGDSREPVPPSDSQPSEGEPSLAPGTPNVRQARGHMGDAARNLDRAESAEAGGDQQKAIDQLEQARQQLQEAIDQLRREQQEAILRGLEARFRAMLDRQVPINAATTSLAGKGRPNWTHGEEVQLTGLARDETTLAGEAAEALKILQEEGTTVVFPRVVGQLREDMQNAASLLAGQETGKVTQQTEARIVATLEELIASVKELRRQIQAGESPGQGQACGQSQPLLPNSAELKLLRLCQIRVHEQTKEIHQGIEAGKDSAASPLWQPQLKQTADRQRELADLARQMNERMSGP